MFSPLQSCVLALAATVAAASDCVYPGTCTAPAADYSRVAAVTPRHQWGDNGGYCGALSVQEIALSYGAWISQDVVRKATSNGGGHGDPDNGWEILHTNIGQALSTLKFTFEEFDYEHEAQPQSNAYLAWLKKSLAAGYPVVWFIMCAGDGHNSYGIAEYDHVEGVFGLYSNHSLDDPTVYPEDVLVHTSDYAPDGNNNTGYFRRFDTLVDDTSMSGNCSHAIPHYGYNEMYPCVMNDIDYGYAIKGQMLPSGTTHQPVSVSVDRIDEPDIIEGQAPVNLTATLTISEVESGVEYGVYRFDGYENLPFTISDYASTAAYSYSVSGEGTVEFQDPVGVLSSGSTYYRVVPL